MKEQTPDFYPLPWTTPQDESLQHTAYGNKIDVKSVSVARCISSRDTISTGETRERQQATKITGNLVYTPRFDIREDSARVNFVLAQHGETGETTYHRIFSTKEYAKRIQNKGLRKGDLVEVAGVWQKHVLTDAKTGAVRETPVFYCYGASLRGRSEAKAPGS